MSGRALAALGRESALGGSPAPTDTNAGASVEAAEAKALDTMFPSTAPKAESANHLALGSPPADLGPGERLYDPRKLLGGPGTSVNRDLDQLQDHGLLTAAARGQRQEAYALLMRDLRLSLPEAERLHELATQTELRPPDDATVVAWGVEARRELRERYGAAGADEANRVLARGRALIARHPVLGTIFKGPLNSHPEVLRLLLARASRLPERA